MTVYRNWNLIYKACRRAALSFLPRNHLFFEDLVHEAFYYALKYSERRNHPYSRTSFWYFAAQGYADLFKTSQKAMRGKTCAFDETYMVECEHDYGDPIAVKRLTRLCEAMPATQLSVLHDVYVKDLKLADIAKRDGTSHQNNRQLLHRGLRNARYFLATGKKLDLRAESKKEKHSHDR